MIDTGKSIYTSGKVPWLSHVVGGFLFGFGMTLASGCGSKTLIRAGAGNLKSVIVIVFLAAAAYMTLKGVFAPMARQRPRYAALGRRRQGVGSARRSRWRRASPAQCAVVAVDRGRARWLMFIFATAISARRRN